MSSSLERVRETLNRDGEGYRLRCDKETGQVSIRLFGEPRTRCIGQVLERHEVGVLYTKRVRDHHSFKATQAWGINMDVLNALNEVGGTVVIVASDADYSITAWGAIAIGDVRQFKKSNCEKQVFVPKKHFIKTPGYGRPR